MRGMRPHEAVHKLSNWPAVAGERSDQMEDTQELPMRFETLAVHAGGERDETGAIAPPLHLSTNYEHSPSGEPRHGYLYARMDNPIQRRLESALAAVEGGQAALVFASGVAAGAAYLQSLPAGSHVLFSDDLFYGFRAMAPSFLPRWGIDRSEVDMTDLEMLSPTDHLFEGLKEI